MTMQNQKKQKQSHYFSDVLKAAFHYHDKSYSEAMQFFRKSGEAFMKYRLYEHFDESKVMAYLNGTHKLSGTSNSKVWKPLYSNMKAELEQSGFLQKDELAALEHLAGRTTNEEMHDSDDTKQEYEKTIDYSIVFDYSRKLTSIFYNSLRKKVPQELLEAYEGKVDASVLKDHCDFSELMEAVEQFDDRNKYILVSPPDDSRTSVGMKSVLARIPWSFVIDFDPATKGKNGLFTAFDASTNSKVVPLSIDQYEEVELPVSTGSSRINWLFANGLQGSADTTCSDFRTWNKRKYGKFIKKTLELYLTANSHVCYIICLGMSERYVKEIIRSISDIEAVSSQLVNFVFLSPDEEYLEEVSSEADGYDFNSYSFEMDANSFIYGVEEALADGLSAPASIASLVPTRANGVNSVVDLSSYQATLKDGGIDVIHANICNLPDSALVPDSAFFSGEDITWDEMSREVEASRKVYDELARKVKARLTLRQSSKFLLFHSAGAGGTTLSRRLAYNLRKEYPVILLNKYVKGSTEEKLHIFHMQVKMPVLVIVEASKVNITTIDSLIRDCNYRKQIFLFVVVERGKRDKTMDQQTTVLLKETMADIDEKNRFVDKVIRYRKDSPKLGELKKTPAAKCEVIDFSLAISADGYKQEKIEDYVSYYNSQLSQPLNEFVLFVSMIYHYSQKEVPEAIFFNLFKKDGNNIGLQKYLRSHHSEEYALLKILSNVADEDGKLTLWRPRYARFAKAILDSACTNGGWNDIAYDTSINLIKRIKSNQDFLVDDTRQILISVFLERGKEDLLGVEEVWAKDNNAHFSQLLEDLGYSVICQRNVLMRLAKSFPSEAHFWGHLARFCYEKATTPKEFNEAMDYVQKAFGANGESDFNLQHIAGMCKRRLLEYNKREGNKLHIDDLKELVEESRGYFAESRRLNSKNIYAYISEIQLIVILIEYGKSLSSYTTYKQFLFSQENEWFQEQYVSMLELIDETKILLSQMKTLGKTHKFYKSTDYLRKSESQTWAFVDDLPGMLNYLSSAIDKAMYDERPRLRQLYVRYLLLSKVKGDWKRLSEAWDSLSDKEQRKVEEYLNNNIQQGNTHLFSLRYWFQFIRKCRKDIPIDEIISRLQMLAKASDAHPLVNLEANYNTLTLMAFSIIHDKDYFDKNKIREIQELAENCHQHSVNDKYICDLLVDDRSISGIVPYSDNIDFSKCIRLHGTIANIRSVAQGEIKLDCGLTAFFAPQKANLIGGRDESKEVTFVVGFRHDGLFALEVRLTGQDEECENSSVASELEEENAIENLDVSEGLEDDVEVTETSDGIYEIPRGKLKILGKIDLNQKS